MNYEIVELKEKIVVGYKARTSNTSPEMQSIIGGLWQKLYMPEHVAAIANRTNEYAIGLYSDYQGEEYDVTAGFEVSKMPEEDSELSVKVIPAGKYAKFSIHGDMVEAVANAWKEIWQTPLDRTFTGDFEEYITMTDIDIYIAVK
ncbi:MAG: GyrI-like domain-containing protein [Lachnospiraceae bacterium]|nr:GyrI-like domain-containing protein [Lachnospiraceae bacterium]